MLCDFYTNSTINNRNSDQHLLKLYCECVKTFRNKMCFKFNFPQLCEIHNHNGPTIYSNDFCREREEESKIAFLQYFIGYK